MKGKTLARKARANGWFANVTSVGGGSYRVHIYRGHFSRYQRDIHLECDNQGNVVKATYATREIAEDGEFYDAAGFVENLITE